MDDYIAIATLNDYIFCPYSIYLHNVYMDTDEGMYKATPQIKGTLVHEGVDHKTSSTKKTDIFSIHVYSDTLGVFGKIDVYKTDKKQLIERKNNLKQIFRGQIYQLWAQYYCMIEMGYEVKSICFYEISTHKTINVPIPSEEDRTELVLFINKFRNYKPSEDVITVNPNKCSHCIYCNLCDKTDFNNVYT